MSVERQEMKKRLPVIATVPVDALRVGHVFIRIEMCGHSGFLEVMEPPFWEPESDLYAAHWVFSVRNAWDQSYNLPISEGYVGLLQEEVGE